MPRCGCLEALDLLAEFLDNLSDRTNDVTVFVGDRLQSGFDVGCFGLPSPVEPVSVAPAPSSLRFAALFGLLREAVASR
jgi:hypothetical protein